MNHATQRAAAAAAVETLEVRRLFAATPWNQTDTTEVVNDAEENAVVEATADGILLVARDGFLHRYIRALDGRAFEPDTTFGGGDGVVELTGQRFPFDIDDIKVAGGKILLAGQSVGEVGSGVDLTIARLNDDGSLDTTFGGSAKGYANTAAGVAWAHFGNEDDADALAVAADGRIAVVGSDSLSAIVAVFEDDGSLDTNCSTDGKLVWAPFLQTSETEAGRFYDGYTGRAVTFTQGGQLIVGGALETGVFVNPGFNVDIIPDVAWVIESLDPSGGTNWSVTQLGGTTQQGRVEDMAALPNGQILVAGSANQGWRVVRLDGDDGALDTTFGDNGQSLTGEATEFTDRTAATRIALAPDGSYFLLGRQMAGLDDVVYLAHYHANGTIDIPFAGDHSINGMQRVAGDAELGALDLALVGENPVALVVGENDIGVQFTRLVYAIPPTAARAVLSLATRVLTIMGSEFADNLHVHVRKDGRTVVVINGVARSFPTRKIRRIHMYGLGGNDNLTAGRRAPGIYIDGGIGDDFVQGQSGNDLLAGGNGNDTIVGNHGHDRLLGQGGRDLMHGNDGNDSLFGQAAIDTLHGDAGNDFLHGENDTNDNIYGGAGDDIAVLDEKDNVLEVETTQISGTPPG